MSRFIFDWPDDLRDQVEARRKERGHKATAETVRELLFAGLAASPPQHPTPSTGSLIDGGKKKGAEPQLAPERTKTAGPGKKGVQPQESGPRAGVPFAGDLVRKPMQKSGKPKR